jgi:hypothetical protein
MRTSTISQHFSTTYAQARQQFFEAVRHAKLEVEIHVLAANAKRARRLSAAIRTHVHRRPE